MTNIHTSIGALELGDSALSFDDAMLEQSGKVAMSPMPTSPLVPPCGRHIDDAMLEQAMTAGPTPTTPMYPMCHHIDDTALEQAAQVAMNPAPTGSPFHPMCRHIDDGALEQTGAVTAGPMPTRPGLYCH